MPTLGRADYRVLNVVALKKMTSAGAVADITGLPTGQVEDHLEFLAGLGLVETVAGSALPSDGAGPALKQSAAEHYAVLRADPEVLALAGGFEDINRRLLAAMSAWQQVDMGGQKVANDHTDSAYDDKVITRIDRLVQRLDPLLAALAAHDDRFGGYRDRFAAAQQGIDAGRHELVSSPVMDSVHTIWFEFHEDLLRTLGRERQE
jgi:hypothetical protein